jgi:hypothetical protein
LTHVPAEGKRRHLNAARMPGFSAKMQLHFFEE